jgi:hypothetical protein
MASNPTITSSSPTTTAAPSMQTVFITVTTTASPGTPVPTLTPAQVHTFNRSQMIAQSTAIGVLGVYVLFAICMFSFWITHRLRREPPPDPPLLPETTQHDRGSFLPAATVGSWGKRKRNGRRNDSGTSYSSISTETRSTRSMFYEGPGTPVASTGDIGVPLPTEVSRPTIGHRRYSSSVSNLIPLQNHSPPLLSPYTESRSNSAGEIEWEQGDDRIASISTRSRSRSSSHSTLRYYMENTAPEPMPSLPSIAFVEPRRSTEFHSIDLTRR